MTNTNPNIPPEPPESQTFLTHISRFVTRPRVLITGGSLIALGVVGYVGLQYFVVQKLPSLIESELSKTLQREVNIGEVENFSLTHLRIGKSEIPATLADEDTLSLQAVDVKYNLLPLLIGRPLPLEITLVDPNLYIEQDKNGKWIEIVIPTEKPPQQLPLKVDAQIHLENVNIALKPYQKNQPVTIAVQGDARYTKTQNQTVSYDLNVQLLKSKIKLEGNTVIETGKSQVDLTVQRLALRELAAIIPNLPIKLEGGEVNGDVNVNVPGGDNLAGTRGKGRLNISKIAARIPALQVPIKVNSQFSLQGQKIILDEFEASLSSIRAEGKGEIDWEKGYDLDIEVQPFNVGILSKLLPFSLPVNLDGKLGVLLQIRGTITEPVIRGKINNHKLIKIDQVEIKEFTTQFQTDLNQFTLQKFSIKPSAGGEIKGNGQLKLNILKSLEEEKAINWDKIPLAFNFKLKLPTKKLVSTYVNFPDNVNVGNLSAEAKIRGTLLKPEALVKWQSSQGTTDEDIAISGVGELLLIGENIIIRNTQIKSKQGRLTVEGTGNIKSKRWQTLIKAKSFSLDPFIEILCNNLTQACPHTFIITPTVLNIANIRASGKLDKFDLNNIKLMANLRLNINEGTVTINSQLSQGNITSQVFASQLALDGVIPNATIPINLQQSRINLIASLPEILAQNWQHLQAVANLRLTVADNPIIIDSQVNQGIINAVVNTQRIPVNQFIPNLTIPVSIAQSQVNFSGSIAQLFALDLNQFTAQANLNLNVVDSSVKVITNIENSIFNALTQVRQFSLNKLMPEFPVTLDVKTIQANISGNVQTLLTSFLAGKPDLSSIQTTVNLNLNLAQGTIITQTKLKNNQWHSNIIASEINTPNLLQQLIPTASSFPLPDSEAKITLAGNINSLLKRENLLTINAETISVKLGEQNLKARGNLLISNLFTAPDATAHLEVQAESNLSKLPLTAFLEVVPIERSFLPKELNLDGKGQFQGRIVAKNILTAPTTPGNLQLEGQIKLLNLVFNDRPFDPILKGTLNASIGQPITINLVGEEDIITANLEPCSPKNCLFPYLPASFQLRQTLENQQPLIVNGTRKKDNFIAEIENFSLDWLKIAPAAKYGISGYVKGNVNLNLNINLFTLASKGEINITNAGLGKITANSLKANFSYQDQLAQLTTATLELGKSKFIAEGYYNLENNGIQAQIKSHQGRVEDMITALGSPDVDTLLTWLQFRQVNYTTAANIQPQARGEQNASLKEQINLRNQLEQQMLELARQRNTIPIPTELNIRGNYTANFSLSGTLTDPQIDINFQGKNWAWYPLLPFPDVVDPLGIVMINREMIPINEVTLKASFADGIITLQPASISLKDTRLFLEAEANLLNLKLAGNFGIEKLSMDTISDFLKSPLDIAGELNANGALSGTIFKPQATGTFNVMNVAYNARLLNKNLSGSFNYTDAQLQVITDKTSFIQVNAIVPYPPKPKQNDEIKVIAKLGTEALELVNIFTQNQVNWVSGEGDVNIDLTLPIQWLDQGNGFKISLDDLVVDSSINLTDTTLESPAFPAPLQVNGEIRITQEQLNVTELVASFTESQINIQGNLPLLTAATTPLDTPLTVAIDQGKIDLQGLYQGNIDSNIIITGTAFKPTIGGQVKLSKGRVFIPKARQEIQQVNVINKAWIGSRTKINLPITPELQNLQVTFETLSINQDPLFSFIFGGELTLNGRLDQIDSLQPNGVITLEKGDINYLQGRFLLNRRRKNQIVFDPNLGILNPNLNIQMRAIVSDFPESQRERRSSLTNEIPDESLNRVRRVDIALTIDGRLSQLFPAFGKDVNTVCKIFNDPEPIRNLDALTEEQLKQLEICVQTLASEVQTDEQLISSGVIKLSSSPPRSEGEIIRLLGDQLFVIAESLQGKNTSQLLNYGVIQLAIPLILQDLAYDVETSVSNSLNMADFRILPYLEAVYQVDEQGLGFVRISYDYNFNEVTVKYETSF